MKKKRFNNHIGLQSKYIPYNWMENLVANGKIGGVMLVFVEGFDEVEINDKVKAIKDFCKDIKLRKVHKGATKLGHKHTQAQKDMISKSIKASWKERKEAQQNDRLNI